MQRNYSFYIKLTQLFSHGNLIMTSSMLANTILTKQT